MNSTQSCSGSQAGFLQTRLTTPWVLIINSLQNAYQRRGNIWPVANGTISHES